MERCLCGRRLRGPCLVTGLLPLWTCECGSPKHPVAEACDRCLLLDGASPYESRIIEALRSCDGWVSKTTLALETRRSRRTVERNLARLMAAGRVQCRHVPNGDKVEAVYMLVSR